MDRQFIDADEMRRRKDPDFMASLDMLDEGAPVHYAKEELTKRRKEWSGFDEKELPQTYQ
ncbi:hypothetical protein [Sporosarcina saromensis]|uniref:YfhD-like protein n=1 Tax=Sporosarcina saromensis TaxID=359365 RepID=A0ABU4GAN7_9BACL|nr:hypothetical protein [Sporosarcina saromensis]MDW0113432.1 hypothetical protein [Sporosarcina saromensis]